MGSGRLVGGADNDMQINLGEDEDEISVVDVDEEDEEDEGDGEDEDGMSDLSSGLRAFLARDSTEGFRTAPADVGKSDFTIPKMVDNTSKLLTLTQKASRLLKTKVIPNIPDIPRKDFSPSLFELGQVLERIDGELDGIIHELRVYLLFSRGEATTNRVFNGYEKLKEEINFKITD
jgi:hypothetical protein